MEACICNGPLMGRIKAVDEKDLIEPEKAEGTFEPIAKMSFFEKQAYTVMTQLFNQAKEMVEAISAGQVKSNEVGKVRSQAKNLVMQMSAAENLLFFSIRDRLGHWEGRLEVSQGWKIVIPEEEATATMVPIVLDPGSPLANLLQQAVRKATAKPDAPIRQGLKVAVAGPSTLN